MTISTQSCTITVEGDGATTIFGFDFEVPYQADGSTPAIVVYYTDTAGTTVLVDSGDYTVAGVGLAAGGSVTWAGPSGSPPALGTSVTISRALEYTQSVAFPAQGFRPASVERMGDDLEMQLQQIELGLQSTVRYDPPVLVPPLTQAEMKGKYFVGDPATGFPVPGDTGIVVTGSALIFPTRTAIGLTTLPAATPWVMYVGFTTVGDCPPTFCVATSAGAGTGKFQSGDGQWFIVDMPDLYVASFGAVGTSGDAAIINAVFLAFPGRNIHLGPVHPCSVGLVNALPIRVIPYGSGTVAAGGETFYGTRLYATADMAILLDINVTAGGGNEDMGGYVGPLIADGNGHATRGVVLRGSHCVKWHLDQVNALNCKSIGIDVQGNHSHLLTKCQGAINGANGAGDAGIAFSGANSSLADCCNAEANPGNGILVNAGYLITIKSGAQEGNARHGTFITGSAQLVNVEGVDYEGNGSLAANTYADALIDGTNNSGCSLKGNKSASSNVKYSYWNRGLNNILDDNVTTNKLICWAGATALNGTYRGLMDYIHADTVWGRNMQVINTNPLGFSTTTPAFPATGVTVTMPLLNGKTLITIVDPGTVSTYTITDLTTGSQVIGHPLTAGQEITMSPSSSIVFTHAGAGTWRWRQI